MDHKVVSFVRIKFLRTLLTSLYASQKHPARICGMFLWITMFGALGWNRTNDPLLKRQVLYRLSYERLLYARRTVLYLNMVEKSRDAGKYVLMLHDIRSVYNVGALFRTADAIGITSIILSGYSPTPIDRFGRRRPDMAKSALGSEQAIPWEYVDDPLFKIQELKEAGYQIVGVEQDERSVDYKTVEKADRMVFVLGTETTGMIPELVQLCDTVVEIPMNGMKESLNVSVAAGIVLYRILDK